VEFVSLFNRAYSVGLAFPDGGEASLAPDGSIRDSRILDIDTLKRVPASSSVQENPETSLVIVRLRKSSPLTFWVEATKVALALAVVISGGEVDLSKGKFKVHALGDGLKELKELFQHDPPPLTSRKKGKSKKNEPKQPTRRR
jgi:hypothetical protein